MVAVVVSSGQKRPSTSSRTLQQQQPDLDLEGGGDQRERRTATIESGAMAVNNNCAAPAALAATAAAAGAVLCLELSYHSRLRPPVSSLVRPADCSVCRRIVSADVDNSLRRVVRTVGRTCGRSTPEHEPARPPTTRLASAYSESRPGLPLDKNSTLSEFVWTFVDGCCGD
jgi:hypothetical protein